MKKSTFIKAVEAGVFFGLGERVGHFRVTARFSFFLSGVALTPGAHSLAPLFLRLACVNDATRMARKKFPDRFFWAAPKRVGRKFHFRPKKNASNKTSSTKCPQAEVVAENWTAC